MSTNKSKNLRDQKLLLLRNETSFEAQELLSCSTYFYQFSLGFTKFP